MVLEFLLAAFKLDDADESEDNNDNWALRMIEGLTNSKTFQKTLQEVLNTSHQKRMHQGTIMGTIFLAHYAKYLVCKQCVGIATKGFGSGAMSNSSSNLLGNSSIGSPTTPSGSIRNRLGAGLTNVFRIGNRNKNSDQSPPSSPSTVVSSPTTVTRQGSNLGEDFDNVRARYEVTSTELNNMLDFICQDGRNRNSYKPRMHLLEAYRHLVKCPSVYALITHDAAYFSRILELCADGVDMEFNRNAWRLFYQLIKFHSTTISHLITFNLMSSFLELIGSGKYSAVTTNSLHYFSKIFNLPNPPADDYVPSKKKIGFNVPSDQTRQEYPKNISKLVTHVTDKNHYVVFHLAFTNLSADYKGWPFQSLVSFYNTLNTSFLCQPMVNKFKRQSKEFKEGLEWVEAKLQGK
jgi:hypothetical protein